MHSRKLGQGLGYIQFSIIPKNQKYIRQHSFQWALLCSMKCDDLLCAIDEQ